MAKSESTEGTEESSLTGFEANRRVRVTATRTGNDIAGNSGIQFGYAKAALVSNWGHPAGTGAIAPQTKTADGSRASRRL